MGGVLAIGPRGALAQDKVLFYSSLTTDANKRLVAGIEEAFPDVEVEWIRAGGVGLFQRFVTERQAGKGKIDILHFSYTPGWYYLADQGWVVEGVAEGGEANAYFDWAVDKDAHFVSLRTPTLQVVYNTNRVGKDEVPKSWSEFITDKWRGRVVMNDPFESAGTWDFFYGNDGVFGTDYIVKLLKNDTLVQRAMGSATDIVARGERDVSFVFEYIAVNRMGKGAPIAFADLEEGIPVIPAPVGMIKDGPNPELGRKIFQFIISPAGQDVVINNVKTYSGRKDFPPPPGPGLKPLTETKLIHSNFKKVYEEQDRYRSIIRRNLRGR